MASGTCFGGDDWCLGFNGLLQTEAENRLRGLFERLVDSVRSVEALAEAERGPRTGWNPYRPVRGEHLQQSILNCEVFEWRSKIHESSLFVAGTALPLHESPITPSNNEAAESSFLMLVTGAGEGANTSLDDRQNNVSLVLEGGRLEETDESSGFGTLQNGSPPARDAQFIQRVVDGIFDALWKSVAVPWISEQQPEQRTQWREARGLEALHALVTGAGFQVHDVDQKGALTRGPDKLQRRLKYWQQGTPENSSRCPESSSTMLCNETPIQELPVLMKLCDRQMHSSRSARTRSTLQEGSSLTQRGLSVTSKKQGEQPCMDSELLRSARGLSRRVKLRGLCEGLRVTDKGVPMSTETDVSNSVLPARQKSRSGLPCPRDTISPTYLLSSRVSHNIFSARAGKERASGPRSARLGRGHRLAPVLVTGKQFSSPTSVPSPQQRR
uniref:Uncharacterized protein n=1 Tax=Trypanosoma vivax (strain Y486) TaxID=1055687 RepID=G0U7E3_TRYVY|nr:conserved hypothetical protein [Trypanosoma vivax Y486]